MAESRRVFRAGLLAIISMALSVGCAFGAPPRTDAERLARIESMYATYALAFSAVKGVRAEDLKRELMAGANVVVVDVRPPEERDVSTIPGAIVPAELESDVASYRRRKIVTFCTIGARSGMYAAELRRRGLDVANLEGSLLAWTHAGGRLVDGDGRPTTRLHVYGKRWALAAHGYEAVLTDRQGNVVPL